MDIFASSINTVISSAALNTGSIFEGRKNFRIIFRRKRFCL
jgi:hypothetical protein